MKTNLEKQKQIFDKYSANINDSRYRKAFKIIKRFALSHPQEKLDILEIACCGGEFLELLKKQGHNVSGIEIAKQAAQRAKDKGINVKMHDVNKKLPYKDNSFDVVFTVATMMYIGTDKINEIIESMIRIAKKRILFVEMYTDNKSFYDGEHWIHNYIKLCKKKGLKKEKINLFKKGDMNDDCWDKCGAIITIIKS